MHQPPARRWPALDGVRGLAALAVVFCHGLAQTEGFSIGVDVFFVLSGFLITALLLREIAETGSVSLASFYRGRALRLLPPLLPVIAVGWLWDMRSGTGGAGALGALLYFQNWRLAWATQFQADALNHTWSLSIEEQYYALWPVILLTVFRLWSWRGVTTVACAGIVVVCFARSVLTLRSAGELRLSYGTDMRSDELLAGALAAALVVRGRMPQIPARVVVPAVVMLIAVAFEPPQDVVLRPLLALSSLIVIVYAAQTAPAWLASQPMRYLGRISYALYLWHFVFFVVALDALGMSLGPAMLAFVMSGGLLFAVLSDLLIEAPIRCLRAHTLGRPPSQGVIGGAWHERSSGLASRRQGGVTSHHLSL